MSDFERVHIPDAHVLAHNIYHARKARDWTQAELAEKANTSPATISSLETATAAGNRRTHIERPTLNRIAAALKVHPNDLLTGEDHD